MLVACRRLLTLGLCLVVVLGCCGVQGADVVQQEVRNGWAAAGKQLMDGGGTASSRSNSRSMHALPAYCLYYIQVSVIVSCLLYPAPCLLQLVGTLLMAYTIDNACHGD